MKNLLLIILSLSVFISCKKEEGNEPLPKISNTPKVVSVTNSSSIKQFDNLVFTVNYQDGDGDLGEVDADKYSIFITDKRGGGILHEFHLQPLAPLDETIAIEGKLLVNLQNVILLDQNNASEVATFEIKLIDRAGNTSNIFTTSGVTIAK